MPDTCQLWLFLGVVYHHCVTRKSQVDGAPVARDEARFTEAQFEREIVRSERVRALALALFFTGGCIYFAVIGAVRPSALVEVFGSEKVETWLLAIFGAGALFEWVLVGRLSQLIVAGRVLPVWERYGSALIETSFPTAYIAMAASFMPAPYAIVAPPAFLYFFFVILSALRLETRLCVFTGGVAATEYLLVVLFYVSAQDWPGMAPQLLHPLHHGGKIIILLLSGAVMGFVTHEVRKRMTDAFQSAAERDRVVNLFGQHVSASVVDALMARGARPETEVRHVCVMFLDIRGFTSYAEERTPEEVVSYLNSLYDLIIEAVDHQGGIVNKFLGDGCLAVFGAPISDGRDCRNAVTAALDVLDAVDDAAATGRIPATRLGIGLHTGAVVTGSVGSARRKEYTIIGDVVNVASRIEQLTKEHGVALLGSEEVWSEVRSEIDAREIGSVPIRGRGTEVKVYSLSRKSGA